MIHYNPRPMGRQSWPTRSAARSEAERGLAEMARRPSELVTASPGRSRRRSAWGYWVDSVRAHLSDPIPHSLRGLDPYQAVAVGRLVDGADHHKTAVNDVGTAVPQVERPIPAGAADR